MKPSIPKGTRDFSPLEMAKRNYIFSVIRTTFYRYGYQQIETPALENLSTLMGKYGEEGDKLLFKVLNSGDFLSKVPDELLTSKNSVKATSKLSEKGLRYDLTVPFARYVVQHRDEVSFPFKRFQIQPVWRADKPQKGRYREFFQCDADVVGSNSLTYEAEMVEMIDEVFAKFGVRVSIKLNNRKILAGIAAYIGAPEAMVDITVAIDKLDKIGLDKVNEELCSKGIAQDSVDKLQPVLGLTGTTEEKFTALKTILKDSEIGLEGVRELEEVFGYLADCTLLSQVELDLTLARGLSYYTGMILEVKALDVAIGSITGGGRYDNLTGIFGLKDISGVGFSFGADRIFDVLNQLDLYPKDALQTTKVLLVAFNTAGRDYNIKMTRQLRKAGISSEFYPEAVKFKKQMDFANKNGIPFVIITGEEEMAQQKVTLKDMTSGEQELCTIDEAITKLV